MSQVRPGAGRGPSALVPLSYLVVAAGAFVSATIGVAWLARELAGHYYHPLLVALTHAVTLGWITLTIMGASYQLIPIVIERPVWSERLARWQLGILAVGLVAMVSPFLVGWWPGIVAGAALVATGVAVYAVNVALSLRGLPRWTFTARCFVLALAGLVLTAGFGLALGVDHLVRVLPGELFSNLHAHVHLALLGWVLPMVLGVAARVYPMFLLAPEPAGHPARIQLGGVAVGVPLLVSGLVIRHEPLVIAGAVGAAAAVIAHVASVVAMARNRRRPALDWGLRFVLTGAAFLVPATALGLALALDLASGPRVALAYAVLALGGWVSLTIAGMMLKIVPFLVWYRVYGPRVGREPAPTLAELSHPRGEATAYALLVVGVIALALGVFAGDTAWIRGAGLVLVAGALVFGGTLVVILGHLRLAHPRSAPTASAGMAAGAARKAS